MTEQGRVLTGLMQRRVLEEAFRALADVTSLDEQVRRAEAIAGHGRAALPVLLAMLDTDDPQLRGGLGQVALRLERDEVSAALRGVARSREQSERTRLSALTLLQHFLKEPMDEALLIGMQLADGAATQSLRELIQAMEREPSAIIEYLEQLAEQPLEVPGLLLAAIPTLPANRHLVTLLRMLAQGDDPKLAQEALEQLGRTRTADAALALTSLTHTLPAAQAARAERGSRKLRMSGVAPPEPEDTPRQALLSAIDGAGRQLIWFISHAADAAQGTLVGIVMQDPQGIVAAYGSTKMPAKELPQSQPVGTFHMIAATGQAAALALLRVPVSVGQQVVAEALMRNWAAGQPTPREYRLFSEWIWASTRDTVENADPAPNQAHSATDTLALLRHPAFADWAWLTPAVGVAAAELQRQSSFEARSTRISALAEAEFGPAVVASYTRRLRGMARWLRWANQPEAAMLAVTLADDLLSTRPTESLFIRRLIGIGLERAMVDVKREAVIRGR